MIEVGASRLNANLAYVLRIFGRPPRTTACDCERATEPALPQTLFRMTDPALMQKLQRRRTAGSRKLAKAKTTDDEGGRGAVPGDADPARRRPKEKAERWST